MAELGWFIFSAGGAVVLLTTAALVVVIARGHGAARFALLLVALGYWAASSRVVPSTINEVLAEGYRPLTREDLPGGRTAVVLLGSSSYRFRDWGGGPLTVVDYIGSSRALEAARAFKLANAEYVVSSGGLLDTRSSNLPSGSAMAALLERLGVPRSRIRIEDESGTTHDEAVIISRMLAAHPVDHVVLVTSRAHMRRSVGAFRAVGVQVIPAIARDQQSLDEWWENVIPTSNGLGESAMVAHELAGILIYQWRGWYR